MLGITPSRSSRTGALAALLLAACGTASSPNDTAVASNMTPNGTSTNDPAPIDTPANPDSGRPTPVLPDANSTTTSTAETPRTSGGSGGSPSPASAAGASDGGAAGSGGAGGGISNGGSEPGSAPGDGGEGAQPEPQPEPAVEPEPTPSTPDYILGADVSVVLQDEYWGATFTDQGAQDDVFEILARHGFNYVRLRTFVNPEAPEGYAAGEPEAWCDLTHTQEAALRAKAAGMGFLLDLHYSDTWADPANQTVPSAWSGFDIDQLEQTLYDYTFQSVSQLRDAGARPDIVQVGNEITNAMAGVSRSNISNFARLLAAGASAVKDVDSSILVMMHIERCHDLTTSRAWLNGVRGESVDFDVFAQSCYGDATGQNGQAISGYHGGVDDWDTTLNTLADEYPDLMFAVAEYSSDKRALNDIVRNLPNGSGLGTFLWDTTRWYDTHPIEPVFTTGSAWSDFISIPSVMAIYEQMADDYGLR